MGPGRRLRGANGLAPGSACRYSCAAVMNTARITQYLVLTSMTLLAVVAIVVMQSKFEGADQRAAAGIVQTYRAQTGRTIVDVLSERHPGNEPVWSTATESSCAQHQRVRATVFSPGSGEPVNYDFMVDINGPSIHPGNPASEEVLSALNAAAPPPKPSASP